LCLFHDKTNIHYITKYFIGLIIPLDIYSGRMRRENKQPKQGRRKSYVVVQYQMSCVCSAVQFVCSGALMFWWKSYVLVQYHLCALQYHFYVLQYHLGVLQYHLGVSCLFLFSCLPLSLLLFVFESFYLPCLLVFSCLPLSLFYLAFESFLFSL
jgi:hypothetical protein